MPAEIAFRPARIGDVPVIATLIEAAYFGASGKVGWTHETKILSGPRTSDGEIAGLIASAGHFLVAERGERLVGCLVLDRQGPDAHLGLFAVDPDEQGSGLGKALMAEGERLARDLWASGRMVIEVVSPRTELIGWYRRRGYMPTGRRLPFPFDTEATVALVEGIELIEMAKEL